MTGARLRVAFIGEPDAFNTVAFADLPKLCDVVAHIEPAPRQRSAVWRDAVTPVRTARRVARSICNRAVDRFAAAAVRSAAPGERFFHAPLRVRMSRPELNGAPGRTLLAGLDLDLIVVSGAPMLDPAVFGIPRLGTVNLHCGIAPDYRGTHTLFVPLLRGDFTAVGVTLHHIDAGVDTGPVLAHGWPALGPRDTLASVWGKCAQTSAELVGVVLTELATRPITGQRRGGAGVLVRAGDVRVRDYVRYLADRFLRGRRPPSLPERRHYCWE